MSVRKMLQDLLAMLDRGLLYTERDEVLEAHLRNGFGVPEDLLDDVMAELGDVDLEALTFEDVRRALQAVGVENEEGEFFAMTTDYLRREDN